MKTWEDVKYLYYGIAKKLSENFTDFCKLYELDDIVDEVYIKTYPFIQSDMKQLTYYIYQETKHVIYTFYRKQYRGAGQGALRDFTHIKFNAIGNKDFQKDENRFDYIDNMDYLETKIAKISFDERILLYLRHVLELTEAMIGRLLSVEFNGIRYNIAPNVISYRLKCIYRKLA